LEKKSFFFKSVYFYSFANIFHWAMVFPFLLTMKNPLPLRMICAKSGQNCFSGSGEEAESLQKDGQTDGQKNGGQRAIRIAHLSFQLR
jgi:hypothetical protein